LVGALLNDHDIDGLAVALDRATQAYALDLAPVTEATHGFEMFLQNSI